MQKIEDPKLPGFFYLCPIGWCGPFATREGAVMCASTLGYQGTIRQFPHQAPQEEYDEIFDEGVYEPIPPFREMNPFDPDDPDTW